MNKLNKIGLSALCGSLACVASANAGEISVSGSTQATWVSNEGSTTGNPLGLNTGLTFSGSGELDGGQKVALTITHADKNAFSAASMSLTTNNFGSIFSQFLGALSSLFPSNPSRIPSRKSFWIWIEVALANSPTTTSRS